MVRPASLSFEIRGNTDRRKDLFFEPSVSFEDRVLGAYEWQMGLEVAVRPSPSWEIELEPNYSNELNPAQYVDTADDIGYAPTFGNGYLFGELKRQSFSLETRINIAFNPKLTLQFYAQPLISSGQYIEYKQLQRSESFDFDVFEEGAPVVGTDDVSCVDGRTCVYDGERYIDFDGDGKTDFSFSDKDFNIRSLRLNAVLRWEYRPGSTLFLVWQQSRRSEDNVGSFNLDDSLSALWDTQPENAFILKLNYWFDL